MVKLRIAGLVLIGACVALLSFTIGKDMLATVSMGVDTPSVTVGGVELSVSIARTKAERQQGLSGTAELPQGAGKLFIFERSERHGFWMKEMNYPIDILWIDSEYRITHIEESVPPESYPYIFKPDAPALYVLEVNAGFVEDFAVREGDIVTFSRRIFE